MIENPDAPPLTTTAPDWQHAHHLLRACGLKITPQRTSVLKELYRQQPLKVNEIAKTIGVSRMTVWKILNTLVDAQIIRTLYVPGHARYELTPMARSFRTKLS